MLKKTVIAILIVAVIIVAFLFFMMKGPDLSQYEPLKEPRIAAMKDQKMVVVEARGDPNVVGGKAFGLLFKTYYKLKGVSKGSRPPAPRARWSGDMNDKSTWVGRYALPIPDAVISLPAIDAGSGLQVSLATWEYGTVAEVLHIGPYAKEKPTIERLHRFIREQGYKIIGYHEEEYVKGPGMFFEGNPEKYYTIIRYQAAKEKPV